MSIPHPTPRSARAELQEPCAEEPRAGALLPLWRHGSDQRETVCSSWARPVFFSVWGRKACTTHSGSIPYTPSMCHNHRLGQRRVSLPPLRSDGDSIRQSPEAGVASPDPTSALAVAGLKAPCEAAVGVQKGQEALLCPRDHLTGEKAAQTLGTGPGRLR